MMLNKLSYILATKLLKKVGNSNYDLEVYVYGFELITSTLACFVTILLFSLSLSELKVGILFIIIFASLRIFTGGYHANTYRKCFVITNLSYILLVLIKKATWKIVPTEVWLCLLVIAIIYIWRKTPIINVAQPISVEKQKICNRNTKIILLLDAIGCLLIALTSKKMMCMMILTVCLVAIFMLIADKSMTYEERRCL